MSPLLRHRHDGEWVETEPAALGRKWLIRAVASMILAGKVLKTLNASA
jgi:hypothetical protein